MAETSTTKTPEPDNTDAIVVMRRAMAKLRERHEIQPDIEPPTGSYDEFTSDNFDPGR